MAPVPVTLVIAGPVKPLFASAKSVVSTPVTDSEKVTVQLTLAAFVGEPAVRLIEETAGGVESDGVIVIFRPLTVPPFATAKGPLVPLVNPVFDAESVRLPGLPPKLTVRVYAPEAFVVAVDTLLQPEVVSHVTVAPETG